MLEMLISLKHVTGVKKINNKTFNALNLKAPPKQYSHM